MDERVGSCGPQVIQPVLCRRYAHPAAAPPPASRSHALLPGPLPSRPWGTSQRPFAAQLLSLPDPLRLIMLPPSLSPRLSCSSMPSLQRYSADDLLGAAPRRYRRLGRALGVTIGMSACLGALLRAFRAPALPNRCPIAALDAEARASGRPGRWPGSSLRSPLPPHRSALARISMPAMPYVFGTPCGASRALYTMDVSVCEHVCPPCPALTRILDRHHTQSSPVLCENIR